MAVLQELNAGQIEEVIGGAVQRTVPAIITIRTENTWVNLHSRMLGVREHHVLLALPDIEEGETPHEFVPAERIGVSFKLKHYKHIFSGTIVAQDRITLEDGTSIPVLAVVAPARMQRLQRRAFLRVDVPANRIVRASFWLGGRDAEPSGTSVDRPVHSGQVTNLSAGGFQLATDPHAVENIEIGETVGVRLRFGTGGDTVYADAQFRHCELDMERDIPGHRRGRALLGFQFLGLTETPEGRIVMQVLSSKVSEFHRLTSKRASSKDN